MDEAKKISAEEWLSVKPGRVMAYGGGGGGAAAGVSFPLGAGGGGGGGSNFVIPAGVGQVHITAIGGGGGGSASNQAKQTLPHLDSLLLYRILAMVHRDPQFRRLDRTTRAEIRALMKEQ
jgi:hypothetical protein